MAQALILDSEAVNALARHHERGVLIDRARAILAVAHANHALIRIPAAVLAEVCRATDRDAPINHLLNARGILVCDITPQVARVAGHLLAKAKLSSAHAIDAFVVATALTFERAVIATGDPNDIRRLAAPFRKLRVFQI